MKNSCLHVSNNVFKKIIYLASIQLIIPLGSAEYITTRRDVETKFAQMIATPTATGWKLVFQYIHRDPLCGFFSKGNKENKCKEILNSEEFRRENPDVAFDETRAEIAKLDCKQYPAKITVSEVLMTLKPDQCTTVNMFQCPYRKTDGADGVRDRSGDLKIDIDDTEAKAIDGTQNSGDEKKYEPQDKQIILVSPGLDAYSTFIYQDGDYQIIGFHSSKPASKIEPETGPDN